MPNNKSQYPSITMMSWFETGIAYIDPDDHGPIGFAFLTFLLLLYDKVVVHSPYAGQIYSAERELPDDLQPLVLEWQDIRNLACDSGVEASPPMIITAFPTYVDPIFDKTRDREFRAIKRVDEERLDPKSAFYRSIRVIQEDPRPANAEIAKRLAEDATQFEKATFRIRDGDLPPRFDQALKGENFFCPKDLADWWSQASPEQKLIGLAAYDHLNDRTALSKGGGNVHCLTSAGDFAANLLFGITDPPFQTASAGTPSSQSQLILELMQILGREVGLPRINADFVRKFRLSYKADFIRDIAGILEEAGQEPDPLRRKRLMIERAHSIAQLDKFPILLGRSLEPLLKLVSPSNLGVPKDALSPVGSYIQEKLPEFDPSRRSRWRYALRKRGVKKE